jgi:hypothetical protein
MLRLHLAKLIAGPQASVTPRGKHGRFTHAPVIDRERLVLISSLVLNAALALYLIIGT